MGRFVGVGGDRGAGGGGGSGTIVQTSPFTKQPALQQTQVIMLLL